MRKLPFRHIFKRRRPMLHSSMRQKYFFRKLAHHLVAITLPILLLGILLTNHFQSQLEKELTIYAERSKNYVLGAVTETLNTFSEQMAIFSTSPSIAVSLSRLLNEQSLDYKNNVMKSIIPTIIGTTANISDYVDSIYIYYDNPYGNFFSSTAGYTSISSLACQDREWLSLYEKAAPSQKQWVTLRKIRKYSFEAAAETLSVFRRFDYLDGVMVMNLNLEEISEILDVNQIYPGSCTLIASQDGTVLFGSSDCKIPAEDQEMILKTIRKASGTSLPYDTIELAGTSYIYYSSTIPEYELTMLSLLPSSEVFRTVQGMVAAFSVIILFSIVLSISLSLSGTINNFRQLNQLLELFSKTETGAELPSLPRSHARNEYDLIFNNIISTFVSNNRLKLNLAEAEIRQRDARLAVLQLQLNPHFIFNTLQTIDLQVLKVQPVGNSSSFLIHNLSDILKYSLENMSRQVRLSEEIAVCKKYAEIQKLRYTNPFILYWEYEEALLDLPIIHLLLQPLLENSLHHAIKELPRPGVIKIKIFKRDERLHFYIIDNGLGISKERLQTIRLSLQSQDLVQTSHIGLYNTNMRLLLTYGPEAALSLSSREGQGTIVHFSIPAC